MYNRTETLYGVFSNLILYTDTDADVEQFKTKYFEFAGSSNVSDVDLFNVTLNCKNVEVFKFMVNEIETFKGPRSITPYNVFYTDKLLLDEKDKYVYQDVEIIRGSLDSFLESIVVDCDVEIIKIMNQSYGFKEVVYTYIRKKGDFGCGWVRPNSKLNTAPHSFATEMMKFLKISDVDLVLHIQSINPRTWVYHLLNKYIKNDITQKDTE